MLETITIAAITAAVAFALGRLSVKRPPPPPVNHDTERLDHLSTTKHWLLFNVEQNAWAVMDNSRPVRARITVRDAIDADMGLQ